MVTSPVHSNLSVLQVWREATFNRMLHLYLLLMFPVLLIDQFGLFALPTYQPSLFPVICYGVILLVGIGRSYAYQLRANLTFALSYIFSTYLLWHMGMLGVGGGHLFVTMILAALLFDLRWAVFVWGVGALIIIALLSAMMSGLLPIPLGLQANLVPTHTLVINSLLLIVASAVTFFAVRSLIQRLELHLQIFADTNTQLEACVNQRTAELQQDVQVRIQTEEYLRTLERRLQLILRTIPDELWFKDREGRYLIVSDALAAAWGHSGTEMIGRRAEDLYDPEMIAMINESDRLVIDQGESYVGEWSIQDQNGEIKWFDGSRTPVIDEHGEVIGQLGIARNINARKQAEAAIAEQLSYAEVLARCSRMLLSSDMTPDAYHTTLEYVLEILRVAVVADRVVMYRYSAISEEQAQQQRTIVAVANVPDLPPQRPPTQDEIDDVIKETDEMMADGCYFSGSVVDYTSKRAGFQRYTMDNGVKSIVLQPLIINNVRWGHISVNDHTRIRTWKEATVQFIRTTAEMIITYTQGYEATHALKGREQMLRDVGRIAQIGGWEIDLQTNRIIWSEEVYAIHELDPAVPITQERAWSFYTPEAQAILEAAAVLCVTEGQPWDLELQCITMQGQQRWVRTQGQPIFADGHVVCVRGTSQNITAQKETAMALLRAKEAAETADRAKSAFLAMMSHEIRTPLNAVIGMTSLLLDSALSPEQHAYVATINTSSNALLDLITDILDLSRIEAGQMVLEEQPLNLAKCLNETLSLVAHQAAAKGLNLTNQIDPRVPTQIYADPTRLRQIVINLLSNAVKFTDHGGVVLDAQCHENCDTQPWISITVRDTGIGITPDQLAHIFKPFVQADSSMTRRYGGSGLGLSISHQLAELMGGSLTASSVPGVGSSFKLIFPARSVPTTFKPSAQLDNPLPVPELSHTYDPPPRLILAEDNPINQLVIRLLLDRLGYAVEITANGREVVDAVVRQPYDIVLMDIQMPEMDGEQATSVIRNYGDSIHQPYIIALTAHALTGDREHALAIGMDAYLSKPIQLEDLRVMLARALALVRTRV